MEHEFLWTRSTVRLTGSGFGLFFEGALARWPVAAAAAALGVLHLGHAPDLRVDLRKSTDFECVEGIEGAAAVQCPQ